MLDAVLLAAAVFFGTTLTFFAADTKRDLAHRPLFALQFTPRKSRTFPNTIYSIPRAPRSYGKYFSYQITQLLQTYILSITLKIYNLDVTAIPWNHVSAGHH